ncbi:MAG TPA: hypothetical protein VGR37_11735 [Longimicrobiaceae bacterium]|nr:hypothetical protein [Longimicrobiaceae bacterium]
MPPPNPQQSVFDTHGAWLQPCGDPAGPVAAFKLAVSAWEELRAHIGSIESRIEEAESRIGDLTPTVEQTLREAAAVRVEDAEQEYLTLEQAGATKHDLKGPGAEWARLRKERNGLLATAREKQGEIEMLEAQVEIDRRELQALDAGIPPLEERLRRLKDILEAPPSTPLSTPPLTVSPTGLNTGARPPRYFRVLFWNLENFTRDQRPRGSAPVDSLRNQARVAVVAHLVQSLGVDALLVMETGSDVGTAMTHVARRLAEVEMRGTGDTRWCEPLVSPATHPVPRVQMDYPRVKLGRPTGDRVLALQLLSNVFRIAPHDSARELAVTRAQMADACRILAQASPAVRELRWLPLYPEPADGDCVRLGNGNDCPGPPWFYATWGRLLPFTSAESNFADAVAWPLQRLGDALSIGQGPASWEQVAQLRNVVHACREGVSMARRGKAPAELGALVELAELGILFVLKAFGAMQPESRHDPVWTSFSSAESSLPLLSFLCTGAQQVRMASHDRDLGPLGAAPDQELVMNALRRVGLVKYNLETYGMVYRPWTAELLQQFFSAPCAQFGFDGEGTYGIMRQGFQGEALRIQQADDVLTGRSALQVWLPAGSGRWIPLALHHNRFTGTAEIREMDDHALADSPYTAEENVLRARALSLLEILKAGAGQQNPPLVLGDFNFPTQLLEEEPRPDPKSRKSVPAWQRRVLMRRELRNGTHLCGYLRRTAGGTHPRTSLTAYATIADGGEVLSQPYDAVYQPFDFLGGTAAVRSGVVAALLGLLPDELLRMTIHAPAPDLGENEDVVLDEEDEGTDEVVQTADDQADTSDTGRGGQQAQQLPVWTALAFEIRRVYRSLLRQAVRAIQGGTDWFRREVIAQADAQQEATRRGRSGEIDAIERKLKALLMLTEVDALDRIVRERADALYGLLLNTPAAVLTLQDDPLDAWITAAETVLDRPRQRPPRDVARLAATLKRVRHQLRTLEQDPQRRLWIAYRAVVSDHLPVVVEIDLQPS